MAVFLSEPVSEGLQPGLPLGLVEHINSFFLPQATELDLVGPGNLPLS